MEADARGRTVARARARLPVDEERDRVLGLRHAVVRLAGSDPRGRARDDARREHAVLDHPAIDVDVVRGQVVAFASYQIRDRWRDRLGDRT
jgi:hypothetical protein